MHAPPMRPRFELVVETPLDEMLSRLHLAVQVPASPVVGMVAGNHLELMIPKERRHFWSPRLSLKLTAIEEQTRLRGLFGPRPSVWTLFATFYAFLGFIVVLAAMFGASQWSIGNPPTAFWGVPIAGVGALVAYGLSLAGQRLAQDEMQLLDRFLRDCIDEPEASELSTDRS